MPAGPGQHKAHYSIQPRSSSGQQQSFRLILEHNLVDFEGVICMTGTRHTTDLSQQSAKRHLWQGALPSGSAIYTGWHRQIENEWMKYLRRWADWVQRSCWNYGLHAASSLDQRWKCLLISVLTLIHPMRTRQVALIQELKGFQIQLPLLYI